MNQKEKPFTFRYRCTWRAFVALVDIQTVQRLETLGIWLDTSNFDKKQKN